MKIDFSTIPEYEIFEDLTTMDNMYGRGMINPGLKPRYFNAEDRKEVFWEYIEYIKTNDFNILYNEYKNILKYKSYSNMASIDAYNNFTFNHPFIVMLHMFIEQGLLTENLELNPSQKIVELGDKVLDVKSLVGKNICEGIVLKDGALMPFKSIEAHKIGALWMFLNGRKINKALRYTTDCIHTDPIFSSMSDYVKMDKEEMIITEAQAVAIFNICQLKSRVGLKQVLEESGDLCLTHDGDPNIRLSNAKTMQSALGSEIFDYKEFLTELKHNSFLYK